MEHRLLFRCSGCGYCANWSGGLQALEQRFADWSAAHGRCGNILASWRPIPEAASGAEPAEVSVGRGALDQQPTGAVPLAVGDGQVVVGPLKVFEHVARRVLRLVPADAVHLVTSHRRSVA